MLIGTANRYIESHRHNRRGKAGQNYVTRRQFKELIESATGNDQEDAAIATKSLTRRPFVANKRKSTSSALSTGTNPRWQLGVIVKTHRANANEKDNQKSRHKKNWFIQRPDYATKPQVETVCTSKHRTRPVNRKTLYHHWNTTRHEIQNYADKARISLNPTETALKIPRMSGTYGNSCENKLDARKAEKREISPRNSSNIRPNQETWNQRKAEKDLDWAEYREKTKPQKTPLS